MKMSTILQNLNFVGHAEGDRRKYYVFQGKGPYLVTSAGKRGSFNVNVVGEETPDVVSRRFKGRRVTSRILREKGGRPDLFGVDFAALNSLYVMVALGRARKLKERDGKSLVFAITK